MKFAWRGLLLTVFLVVMMAVSPVTAQDNGGSTIGLELVADGLAAPVDLESAGDQSGRLFVVDQPGVIYVISADGERMETPFLDIRDRVVELDEGYDERGLLGLDFHPDYASNGRFFVYYTAPPQESTPEGWSATSRVSEFMVSADDENMADPDSERILMSIDQPQSNHNGGDIVFGPDNYLYIPLGDGGAANDQGEGHTEGIGNAQDTSNLLGSILRIDVDNGDPYGIPEDNPFVGEDAIPDEIWAWGVRNPWRISFDRGGDNELFVSDAGQNRWEEVTIAEAGQNLGWRIREGSHCFNPDFGAFNPLTCDDTDADGNPLQPPIIEYSHQVGLVVVGGYVYRGSTLPPSYQGQYFFADWSTSFGQPNAQVFTANRPPEGAGDAMWGVQRLNLAGMDGIYYNEFILAFGEDESGELYLLTSTTSGPSGETGKVWRFVAGAGDADAATSGDDASDNGSDGASESMEDSDTEESES